MKVLIVENETYLAQNLAVKLGDLGFECEVDTIGENALNSDIRWDAVLLCANLIGVDFKEIIKRHAKSIIILMINYIGGDVISAMKMGADDYILKPIIVEEIVRKIGIFESYKRLETLNKSYENFILTLTKHYKSPNFDFKKIKLPLILSCKSGEFAQEFVFYYAKAMDVAYEQISANSAKALSQIAKAKPQNLVYVSEFDELKDEAKREFIAAVSRKNIIISTAQCRLSSGWDELAIERETQMQGSEIMQIDEYVRHAIACYQDVYTDIELAKRLGISRKSLWGKRKRYGITRK